MLKQQVGGARQPSLNAKTIISNVWANFNQNRVLSDWRINVAVSGVSSPTSVIADIHNWIVL